MIKPKDKSQIITLDSKTLTINLEDYKAAQVSPPIILDGNGNLEALSEKLFARVFEEKIVMSLGKPEDEKWQLRK